MTGHLWKTKIDEVLNAMSAQAVPSKLPSWLHLAADGLCAMDASLNQIEAISDRIVNDENYTPEMAVDDLNAIRSVIKRRARTEQWLEPPPPADVRGVTYQGGLFYVDPVTGRSPLREWISRLLGRKATP